MAFLNNFKEDIKRFLSNDQISFRDIFRLTMTQSLYVIAIFRFGHWCAFSVKNKIIRWPLKVIYIILNKIIVEIILGVYIPAQCSIGKGLYLGQFTALGLAISPNAIIGENCVIGHGVLIGTAADGTSRAPKIGNNVLIGTGAVVLGGIEIGNNVRIGANAVVVKNVPDNVTVAGVPAVIIHD